MNRELLKQQWAKRLSALEGRRIVAVRYMTPTEVKAQMWDESALVLILDDGTLIYPKADDEGNGPGALAIQPGKLVPESVDGAPVI